MPQHPAYNPEQIETKWQKRWMESGVFNAEFPSDKPKYYCLIEFPYPSGNGLHVGHPRSNTALDIIARKRRMEGNNVLYPIGYDAFGLPTENFAIKNKIHPAVVTKKNIDHFREQLQRLGFSFDYTREVNTTDPAYYKWTQWIFLKLLENGLAYKAEMPINWLHRLQVRPGQRGGRGRRVRALRQPGGAPGQEPVDAAHHQIRPEAAGRAGSCGLHRRGQDPAAQLDRPQRGRGGGLSARRQGRKAARVHHPARHPLWRDLHGRQPRTSAD